jgi:hypothetical protein
MARILAVSLLLTMMVPIPAHADGKKPLASASKKAESKSGEKSAEKADDAKTVDLDEVKDKLVVLHDGKQHYVAVVPFGDVYAHLYYGDGKRFHAQRVSGGGSSGKEAWDRVFWEPRVDAPWKGSISFKDGKYTVQCGERATEFQPVAAEEQSRLLAAAPFFPSLWIHRSYALARDNQGTYYYVDRLREPEDNKNFRLFAGKRGSLKLMKMTNVVSDSQGDIFTTKKGELRLVLDRKHPSWFAGKSETALINLPLDDNHIMIYTDLGVYAGQRLGTPCDDLL